MINFRYTKHQIAFMGNSYFPLGFRYVVAFSIYILCFTINTGAQTTETQNDTAQVYKNSIKLNVTALLLYDKAFQIGYERILSKNRSINISGGYIEFPLTWNLDLENTQLTSAKSKSGYSIGIDYRFYLAKENKYATPRGVYLAPFINYINFSSDRTLQYTDSTGLYDGSLKAKTSIMNIGGQMGYQFVLWKRFVIDCVLFAPAITYYHLNAKVDGNLGDIDENETIQAAIDAIKEKLPLLDKLAKDKEANSSGTNAFWGVGFRYNISIGFRF